MRDTVAEFDDLGDRKWRMDASVAAIVWRLRGIRVTHRRMLFHLFRSVSRDVSSENEKNFAWKFLTTEN